MKAFYHQSSTWLILITLLVFNTQFILGQNKVDSYLSDKIFVKIANDQLVAASTTANGVVNISEISQLGDLSRSNLLEVARYPFHKASSGVLKRFVEIKISDPSKLDEIVNELNGRPGIEFAEKIPAFEFALTPNDPNYGQQWALTKIGAASAWNYATGNPNVVVAVLDNAFDTGHEDLSANIWRNSNEIPLNNIDDDGNGLVDDINGWDFADMDNNVNPPVNNGWEHGTHVAGITSSICNNNKGIAGIGYGLTIMPIKVAKNANGAFGGLFEAIVYAADNGASVINMSFSTTVYSYTLKTIIDYAVDQGCILVAAAGNYNWDVKNYPAAFENVIGVANTDQNDKRYWESNYGDWIDISAPGTNILSTFPGNNYGTLGGTSMAAPLVAGLIGLMQSLNPALGYDEVLIGLQSTAVNIDGLNPGYTGLLGSGRINASSAMSFANQSLSFAPTAQFTSNFTQIVEGATVQFTDNSLYGPTSWSWNFGDGSLPSNLQNPSHSFSSPGNYAVTLTATNTFGTTVFGASIVVDPVVSCDTIANFDPYNDIVTVYGMPSPNSGYISGHNSAGNEYFADYFNNYEPYTIINGAMVYFQTAIVGEPSATINVSVWEDNAGMPGNRIATKSFLIQEIVDYSGALPAIFDSPVTIPGAFYLGIEIDYPSQNQSTVAMYTTKLGEVTVNTAWYKTHWSGTDTWYKYEEAYNGLFANAITPLLAEISPTASFTQSETLVCEGMTVTYNATGSQNADSYSWSFPGGNPSTSTLASPTVIYPVAGSYNSNLTVAGGCESKVASSSITVDVCTDVVSDFAENNVIVSYTAATDQVDIDIRSWGEDQFNITLINSSGQLMRSTTSFGTGQTYINVAQLPAGIYLVIIDAESSAIQKKVVIQ